MFSGEGVKLERGREGRGGRYEVGQGRRRGRAGNWDQDEKDERALV